MLADARKPVVAAIHGYCPGGGLEIALACDIRIASEDTQFALPEVGLASIPGADGTQRLSRAVGVAAALRLTLTGERIAVAEALRLGLVSELTWAEQLAQRATARSSASNTVARITTESVDGRLTMRADSSTVAAVYRVHMVYSEWFARGSTVVKRPLSLTARG